jgi:pimeloyl-ACP methyl ester carboxylesterase
VLLVHGWGTDRSFLQPLFDHLRRSRRVVAVDLRGFGESDAPEQAYTIHGYADDLAFVATALGLERPVVIGHSMGGLIALDFAARYGDRLSAAVILESIVVAPRRVIAGLRPVLEGVRTARYREVVTGVMTHLTGPHFDPAARARLVSVSTACAQHVLVSTMEDVITFDSAAAAARVACPVLYVGTRTVYADLERFRELCPQLVTEQLVDCGHCFPLEVPDQLDAVIERFVRTLAHDAR